MATPNSQQNKANDISLRIIEYTPPPPLSINVRPLWYSVVCAWKKSSWWYLPLRVLSRIYRLGETVLNGCRWQTSKGGSGAWSPPPKNFLNEYVLKCRSGAFWDTILRNVTVCALTLLCLDDFSNIATYIL